MNPWQKKQREKLGVEVVVSELPGWLFRVRPADRWNKDYHRAIALEAIQPAMRDLLERQSAPDYVPTAADMDVDAKSTRRAFVRGCLAGWEGVTGPYGEPLPFTLENAERVCETFPEAFDALDRASRNPDIFAEPDPDEKGAAILGNSESASSSKRDRGAKRSRSSSAATAGA